MKIEKMSGANICFNFCCCRFDFGWFFRRNSSTPFFSKCINHKICVIWSFFPPSKKFKDFLVYPFLFPRKIKRCFSFFLFPVLLFWLFLFSDSLESFFFFFFFAKFRHWIFLSSITSSLTQSQLESAVQMLAHKTTLVFLSTLQITDALSRGCLIRYLRH